MNFISLLLFSISTNLDNIPIGICYFLDDRKGKNTDILKISFFTSLITFITMITGKNISHIFSIKQANLIGSLTLIIIGSYGIIKEYISKRKKSLKKHDNIGSYTNSIPKIILMLSANNLATGFSASIAGINCFISTILTFVFSMLFLYIGYFIRGKICNFKIEEYSNYISSFIVLILGIIEEIFNI